MQGDYEMMDESLVYLASFLQAIENGQGSWFKWVFVRSFE